MKITLTGSLGNISKPLAIKLIAAGHQVTVISSKPDNKAKIGSLGATAAIGSIDDLAFLTKTFTGADAVYTMVPPNLSVPEYRGYIAGIAKKYAVAIRETGVKRVINLSSIGAHLASGTGPVTGLHDAELILNGLDNNTEVRHLRAGFFFTNFYNDIPLIKQAGIIGSNFSADAKLVLVHPNDIAAAVAEELQKNGPARAIRYVVSDESTAAAVAQSLGTAIGKPALPWVEFADEQLFQGMTGAGLSEHIAANFVELYGAVRGGKLWEDYQTHRPATLGTTKLGDFAGEFSKRFL